MLKIKGIIGADTSDIDAVISFLMKSYLPDNWYFKLAYEVFKNILRLTHPMNLLLKEIY